MQSDFYEFLVNKNKCDLLICEDDKESFLLSQVALFLGYKVFVLPDFRACYGDDLRSFSNELFKICEVLNLYHKENKDKILISPVKTILKKLPSKDNLKDYILYKKEKFNLDNFKDKILKIGYSFVDIVQEKAEICIRGDVIDIFPLNEQNPIRILFFEDEIESIRYFDISTQKSIDKELEVINICPFLSNFNDENYEIFEEKINNFDSNCVVNDINSLGFWCVDDFYDYLKLNFICNKKFHQDEFEEDISILNNKILPKSAFYQDIEISFNLEFLEFHKDKKITILGKNQSFIEQFNLQDYKDNFIKSDLILNLLSKNELIISLNKNQRIKRVKKASLIIDELKIGDYIVHEDYGVGKFNGLEMINIGGVRKEFVSLLYQNNDKLLLPVENLHLIDKYLSQTSSVPNLDKLGKSTFLKLKEKVKEKLFAIASDIVILAAKRALVKPKDIKIDYEQQDIFASKANFSYTKDQDEVCKQILHDFESGMVMDRLLSGDVGFGKTEVAMNAMYPVVKNGYSVFFFVPTTLLSHQHYKTLKKRFEQFDIEVFKLDRFTSQKEKKEILQKIDDNVACIVVGTHTLLNLKNDNLAFMVIDEEHKFGVKQKEKLKELSQNCHILSMSATPIPRSLNQALSSIKSYSVLQTPPVDRLDTRTFVKEQNDATIKEAILRELRRGGQIFYIHNHIATIEQSKKYILDLFPNLRILILHSKIDAKIQEEQMLKFENKEYDLLLCTSIVESGIDLANVNTIIVEKSDRFGMADLHQLRGRVGRSNKQGYCYFLIDDKNSITKDSLKRLVSLESNSYLGAGSVLAYHDLELRGGGNLLGVDQSGHIDQIGYSLYLKMLENEINNFSKKEQEKDEQKLDLKLNVNAFLNPDLINEDRLRIELYRRLSKCKNVNEVYEIQDEIEDRFGKLDLYTKQFLDLIIIKILASDKFKIISNYEMNIQFVFKDDTKELIKSKSKDEDDIINAVLVYLRSKV